MVDQEFLANNGVSLKIIDILFDVFGANVPNLPLTLKQYEEDDAYFAPNVFYALKILNAQGKAPSATSAHKLVGGKTAKFFRDVKTLKELLPGEFEAKPEDSTKSALAAMKRELVMAETAQFKAELEEQERYAGDMLTKDADEYEKRIHKLELALQEKTGQHSELLSLAKDHTRTIESLQGRVRDNAVNRVELSKAIEIADERKETVADLKERAKRDFEAYQAERKASAKIIEDFKDERDHSDSLAKEAIRNEREAKESLFNVIEDREGYIKEVAELQNQIKQSQLSLHHENNTALFIEGLTESIAPLNQLVGMVEALDKITKTKNKDSTVMAKYMNDLSSNLLSLKATLEKKSGNKI